jgi:hypothetical protein
LKLGFSNKSNNEENGAWQAPESRKRGWMNILGQKGVLMVTFGATNAGAERNKSARRPPYRGRARLVAFFGGG